MPLALPILISFAEVAGIAIGAITTAVGAKALSDEVQDYIEDNPEQAEKIFSIIMPEQGLASLFNNDADDGEEITETEVEVETPKLSGKEKGMRIKEAIKRARAGKGNYSSPDAEGPAVDIRGSVIREVEDMGIADPDLKDNYKPSGYTGWKKFANKYKKKYSDGGIMTYAHGGRVKLEPGGMAGEHGMGAGVGKDGNTAGTRGNQGNSYNGGRNMANIAGPVRGPTFSSDGSGDIFAPDDPTLAEKINYTGDTLFGPQQKYSGDGIFSGYRNLDDKGQPLMGMDFVKDKFKGFNPLGMMLGLIDPALGLAYRGFNFMKDKVPETLDTFKESDTLVDFYNNVKETPKVESIVNAGLKNRDAFNPEATQPQQLDIASIQAMINNAKENSNEFKNGGQVGISSMFTRKR